MNCRLFSSLLPILVLQTCYRGCYEQNSSQVVTLPSQVLLSVAVSLAYMRTRVVYYCWTFLILVLCPGFISTCLLFWTFLAGCDLTPEFYTCYASSLLVCYNMLWIVVCYNFPKLRRLILNHMLKRLIRNVFNPKFSNINEKWLPFKTIYNCI